MKSDRHTLGIVRVLIFVSCIASCSSAGYAQPRGREVVNQGIEWMSWTSNIHMNKKISVVLDGQFRYVRELEPMQYLARTWFDIRINEKWSVAPFGYAYIWNYQYGEQPAPFKNNEHRIFQQAMYRHTLGKLKIDHRIRLERRFLQNHVIGEGGVIVDEGYVTKTWRARYRLMGNLPISASNWFLSTYDEVFASWGGPVSFYEPDQNRFFVGAGYQFNKDFNVNAGLLYHMFIKSNGAKQENNVGPQVMFTYNFRLKKPDATP